ncbi:polysaccharide deacetylase family protein [Thermovenabulum gondwanense]|uniref:Peptidoglycan-N-acetylmuramic acid deacetylase PdaA n=1 Tax=Thermovenabulum gondwanense TaxID=520767 RepID=A0A161PW59_9FIRM|nr:polysaccharide deacetylase family protein [Thermovenabulum gondwanense]KYO65283.1 Peptidoglycan-N-acetylmuramic acid deacetylase PdaA [Thermovenabulum gondwanense]
MRTIRKRLLVLIYIMIIALLFYSFYFSDYDKTLRVFSFFDRLLPIYRVETQEKRIAISFDAAWGADKTPEILDILDKYKIKTTFFLVKMWMDKYPEMTKLIASFGHEIGNHSATHPHMGKLSKDEVVKEIQSTHLRIKELTGQDCKVFRPPFGEYSDTLIKTAQELGYYVIQWDVDSLDWKDLSASAIYDRVIKRVKPGSIVLFHNNGKNTPEALKIILPELIKQGYEIVPVSSLLIKGDYYIDGASGEMRKKL